MKNLRIIFMGTPDFAVPCLRELTEKTTVIAAVTQPDKPKGRGQKLLPPPVKVFAQANNIPVYQPSKLREGNFAEVLRGLKPDLIVVVAFGQILPKSVLELPPLGCINVHASLLPRYRGAAPMQRCIINGETETGVTTMFMDEGLDTGDMLLKEKIAVTEDMTFSELHDKLSAAGAKLLIQTLAQLKNGELKREKQKDEESTYAPMIKKETRLIDWSKPAAKIHNLVRGIDTMAALAFLGENQFKIWQTKVADFAEQGEPGEVLRADKNGLFVATGSGVLEIVKLQAAGRKKMTAKDFINGGGISLPAKFVTEGSAKN